MYYNTGSRTHELIEAKIADFQGASRTIVLGKHKRTRTQRERVRSRQCQGFPRNPGRFHPGSGLSPSLDQLGAIEREASFL